MLENAPVHTSMIKHSSGSRTKPLEIQIKTCHAPKKNNNLAILRAFLQNDFRQDVPSCSSQRKLTTPPGMKSAVRGGREETASAKCCITHIVQKMPDPDLRQLLILCSSGEHHHSPLVALQLLTSRNYQVKNKHVNNSSRQRRKHNSLTCIVTRRRSSCCHHPDAVSRIFFSRF